MIGVLKKIWDFAGEEQGNIRNDNLPCNVKFFRKTCSVYPLVAACKFFQNPNPAFRCVHNFFTSVLSFLICYIFILTNYFFKINV